MRWNVSNTVISLVVAVLVCAGCVSSMADNVVFKDERVVIREKTSFLPHGTGKRVLEAGNRTFKNLYFGGYLWIPEWESILFMTHREGSVYQLHIFSLETKRDVAVQMNIPFGSDMGRPKTDKLTCFVEKVDGDIAVLVDRGYKGPDIRYEVDRAKKSFRALP